MTLRFEMQHEVQNTLPLVRGLLIDLRAFGDLHPLMERVESKGQGRYVVHEFKPVLGLRIRFQYEVTVYIDDNAIVYDASPKGLRLILRFQLQPLSENLTRVTEAVEIRGFPLFIPILKKALCASHPLVFAAMARSAHGTKPHF